MKFSNRGKISLILILILVSCCIVSSGVFAKQIIKLTHDMAPDLIHPTHGFALVFKSYVETKTEDEYVVNIYPSNVLGKSREQIELVKANGTQISLSSLGAASNFYKPIILLNTPFMYSSDRMVHAVLESDFSDWLFKDMKDKTGLRPVLFYDLGGLSCFTNNIRPIRKVEDMKGIKFRAMDDSQIAMFEALGANAVPIAWSEVYTSLQTGVVDGQVNPISILVNAKLYEVQKYVTLSRTILGGHVVIVNNDWYEGLPLDVRKIVDEAFYYANLTAKGLSQLSQATGLKELKEHGVVITPITDEAYREVRSLGRTAVLEWCKEKMDPEIVDKFINVVNQIEEGLPKIKY